MFPFEVLNDYSFMELRPEDKQQKETPHIINPFTGRPYETDNIHAIDGME